MIEIVEFIVERFVNFLIITLVCYSSSSSVPILCVALFCISSDVLYQGSRPLVT